MLDELIYESSGKIVSQKVASQINSLKCDEIKANMDNIKKDLKTDIQGLSQGSHKTREFLLTCKVSETHLEWAMKKLSPSSKQTEWVNQWIAKLRLCEDTIDILAGYIQKYCEAMKYVLNSDEEPSRRDRLLQHTILMT